MKSILIHKNKLLEWLESQNEAAIKDGEVLGPIGVSIAKQCGVSGFEKVRVLLVDEIPRPTDEGLLEAAISVGLWSPRTTGFTVGYAIVILRGCLTVRLLSHELAHVEQYERHGSVDSYISLYLSQVAAFGYKNSPMEIEARSKEIHSLDEISGRMPTSCVQ